MENKHIESTPGPWAYVDYAGYFSIQADKFYGSSDLLNIETCPEAESNARLIAASPTMLEALLVCEVTLKAFLPEAFATITIVKEAIAKARG